MVNDVSFLRNEEQYADIFFLRTGLSASIQREKYMKQSLSEMASSIRSMR